MGTPNYDVQGRQDPQDFFVTGFSDAMDTDLDPCSDDLLENINSTPLGRLLKIIGSLPEIRQEKVVRVKRQIDHDQYEIGEHLDEALDKVLEEFIAEN